jgi:hypothetical protein
MPELRLRVRPFAVRHPTPADLEAWAALESRALEPNAFLSPHFIVPALRYLDPHLRVVGLCVERDDPAGEMLALGVFRPVPASSTCPVPHLLGYFSRHSYLGGLLLDRSDGGEALAALADHVRRRGFGWQALVLPRARIDGPIGSLLDAQAQDAGRRILRLQPKTRAVMIPSASGAEAVKVALGKRHKEVERNKRRLAESGPVTWHGLRKDLGPEPVESFLRLEHQGWKLEEKTSLRSDPKDEAFFKEMTQRFDADGRAIFTELRVGARAVSSTCNYVSGSAGFAFKVGWDVEFRKVGPGLLNEVEFLRAAPELFRDLTWFDSGAQPDSYIDKLWPERREIGTLVVPLTRAAALSQRLLAGARTVVRRFRPPRPDPDQPPAAAAES